jgi:hypothetical protein
VVNRQGNFKQSNGRENEMIYCKPNAAVLCLKIGLFFVLGLSVMRQPWDGREFKNGNPQNFGSPTLYMRDRTFQARPSTSVNFCKYKMF